MNPFTWIRNSVAESVCAGWFDGLARIEQQLKNRDSTRPNMAVRSDDRQLLPASETALDLPEVIQQTRPLAKLVQNLQSADRSQSAANGENSAAEQEPRQRPRKHR